MNSIFDKLHNKYLDGLNKKSTSRGGSDVVEFNVFGMGLDETVQYMDIWMGPPSDMLDKIRKISEGCPVHVITYGDDYMHNTLCFDASYSVGLSNDVRHEEVSFEEGGPLYNVLRCGILYNTYESMNNYLVIYLVINENGEPGDIYASNRVIVDEG